MGSFSQEQSYAYWCKHDYIFHVIHLLCMPDHYIYIYCFISSTFFFSDINSLDGMRKPTSTLERMVDLWSSLTEQAELRSSPLYRNSWSLPRGMTKTTRNCVMASWEQSIPLSIRSTMRPLSMKDKVAYRRCHYAWNINLIMYIWDNLCMFLLATGYAGMGWSS